MTDIPDSVRRMALDRDFQPSIRIGKTGITDNLIIEIKDQLAKRKIVKIKINKGIFDRAQKKEVWEYICQETSASLVSSRGNVGVIWAR